ncbi:response regulator [Haloarcula nitratireducens]|uniref:Response regulatory domain-containing protein n=1 Tax=Haloarcula nitratireducens TaxID=2487749 RepID=A0AAW4PA98_9EURY|nr:response regulator [Halomicroarcula nitratireducens]MBX0294799.1 hypothetical protein [Halomicroarcula nitratireducens]
MGTEWSPVEREERARVLHVDDNVDFLDVSSAMVARQSDDLEIDTLADPARVTERPATTDVDCVVSDYDVEPIDGLELLRTVRADHRGPTRLVGDRRRERGRRRALRDPVLTWFDR